MIAKELPSGRGKTEHPPYFLLAEDDLNQVNLIRLALEEADHPFTMDDVANGVEALAYLRREGSYVGRQRPNAVILDLNMPKVNGHEVLKIMKNDPRLKSIRVVVLTTSTDDNDRIRAYENHVNSYLVKPHDYEQYEFVIRGLEVYWSRYNTPPVPAGTVDAEMIEAIKTELDHGGGVSHDYSLEDRVGLVQLTRRLKKYCMEWEEYRRTGLDGRGECLWEENLLFESFEDVVAYLEQKKLSMDGLSV
jgi:chemotaxis family two-component system response regulator Rcp1